MFVIRSPGWELLRSLYSGGPLGLYAGFRVLVCFRVSKSSLGSFGFRALVFWFGATASPMCCAS